MTDTNECSPVHTGRPPRLTLFPCDALPDTCSTYATTKKRDLRSLLGTSGGGVSKAAGNKPSGKPTLSILQQAKEAVAKAKRARTEAPSGARLNGGGGAAGAAVHACGNTHRDSHRRDGGDVGSGTGGHAGVRGGRWRDEGDDGPELSSAAAVLARSRWGGDASEDDDELTAPCAPAPDPPKQSESYMDKMVREAMEFKMANLEREVAAKGEPERAGADDGSERKRSMVDVAKIMAMHTPSTDGEATPACAETPHTDGAHVVSKAGPRDRKRGGGAEGAESLERSNAPAAAANGVGSREAAAGIGDARNGDALDDLDDLEEDGNGGHPLNDKAHEDDSKVGTLEGQGVGAGTAMARDVATYANGHAAAAAAQLRGGRVVAAVHDGCTSVDSEDPVNSRAMTVTPRSASPASPWSGSGRGRSFDMLAGCRSVFEYEQLNRIDEGTYGVVFRARDKKTGVVYALKKVKMEKEREGFPLTALREANILLSMSHPNIVNVTEMVVGTSLDSIFMVMEFAEHDLKGFMENMAKPFTIPEVKCLMLQLLGGVSYLHDNWVLHRDLKTSNILINNRGELKICDFGLARQYSDPLRPYTHMVVTLWYRAPELLLGQRLYSTAIDMWSLGCIMGELLGKEPLFTGKTEIDQIDRIFKVLGTPNEKVWPDFVTMPTVKKIKFLRQPYNTLRQLFPKISPGGGATISDLGFNLLNSLLAYDPKRRLSAQAALQHEFFAEFPPPQVRELMPTYPSRAAGANVEAMKAAAAKRNAAAAAAAAKAADPLVEQRRREEARGGGGGGLFSQM